MPHMSSVLIQFEKLLFNIQCQVHCVKSLINEVSVFDFIEVAATLFTINLGTIF